MMLSLADIRYFKSSESWNRIFIKFRCPCKMKISRSFIYKLDSSPQNGLIGNGVWHLFIFALSRI